ncbi:hypothetical protein [Kushneria sp. TE3]|uniref:hypothetical protein n=1 Tax=Kushneria sp. TE3 TaxID=3449832 RepID=UPI003F689041
MPLPLILGAGALISAVYGAKKSYDGYQSHSEADDIAQSARAHYDKKKKVFDVQERATSTALEMLGNEELEIGKRFGEFKVLADKLQQQLNAGRHDTLEINIPEHKLQGVEDYSYTAIGVLGTMAGAGAAGAAAGFAIYGSVMALGAASTGTAISSLAGVAAYNATLAAVGGGSLATGGLGMAGGTAILGAAIAGPVLAIAGWAYSNHGDEALRNAHEVNDKATKAVQKLEKACEHLDKTRTYTRKILSTLMTIDEQFVQYFDKLKKVDDYLQDLKGRNVDMAAELAKFDESLIRIIENGYALAVILVDVITTPIFKVKMVDGELSKDENGMPVMETDKDGSMVLNDTEIDKRLIKAGSEAENIEAA